MIISVSVSSFELNTDNEAINPGMAEMESSSTQRLNILIKSVKKVRGVITLIYGLAVNTLFKYINSG